MTGIRILALDGATTIGGSKIVLGYDDKQVLLDFGTNFSKTNRYYEEYLKPRSSAGLLDFIVMGVLPESIGIYREDLVPPELRLGGPKIGKIDALILSHAHADHFGDMGFLRIDIPAITSPMSLAALKAITDTGKSDIGKDYISPSLRETKTVRGAGILKARSTTAAKDAFSRGRSFSTGKGTIPKELADFWMFSPTIAMSEKSGSCKPYLPGQLRQSGYPIDCELHPVDHSVKGAVATVIRTEQGNVIYTGDLRLHGLRKNLTEQFIQTARSPRPRTLIIEGTRAGRASDSSGEARYVSEEDVLNNARNLVSGMSGDLVIADFGARNIERLEIFHEVAEEHHRKLVVTTKDAYLLHAMHTVDPSTPIPGDSIAVYDSPKGSEQKFEDFILTRAYPECTVDGASISKSPGDYLIAFSFFDLKYLIDIRPTRGHYLYSSCEAFSEEQKIDFVRMGAWLSKFGLKVYGFTFDKDNMPVFDKGPNSLHASGHATRDDLVKIVEALNPEVVAPVHTTDQKWFSDTFGGQRKVIALKEGEWANI